MALPKPQVLVTVDPTPISFAPNVMAAPQAITVTAASPAINVAAPTVTVAPPTISVAATAPVVNVAAAAAPTVNVAAPTVSLTPTFAPVNNYTAPAITVTAAPPSINVTTAAPNIYINPMQLATALPLSETRAGAVGSATQVSPADHAHPTVASRTYHTLASDGGTPATYVATVNYTRTFTARPLFAFGVSAAVGQPVIVEHVSDIMGTGTQTGLFIGCVIRGRRAQNLPTINIATLLPAVISALSNFDPLGGSAAGTAVCVIALPPS